MFPLRSYDTFADRREYQNQIKTKLSGMPSNHATKYFIESSIVERRDRSI